MYISSVNLLSDYSVANYNVTNQKKSGLSRRVNTFDTFQKSNVAFGNIQTTVTEYAGKRFKNLNELEDCFNTLMKELLSDKNIEKSPYFAYLTNRFEKSGFRGLLENLRMPKSTPDVDTLVENARGSGLDLAKTDNEPVVSIFNWGRHGLFGGSSSTRDIRLLFLNAAKNEEDKAIIEFTMDRKGFYMVFQREGLNCTETAYYPSTGNKRYETRCYGSCKPDTTYYNKDGSEAFFENWFHGGTPAEPIY